MKRVPTGIIPVIAVDRASAKPLHRQIYEGFREAIVERRLRAGQRLPSTRGLAAELGISRIPVLQAFEQLLAEGYFESRTGAGTFVAGSLPDDLSTASHRPGRGRPVSRPGRPGRRMVSRAPEILLVSEPKPWLKGWGAFRVSQPAVDHFPLQIWSGLVARHARNPARQMVYGDPLGYRPFREAVADVSAHGARRALRARSRSWWSAAPSRRSTSRPACCWSRTARSGSRSRATTGRGTP